VTRFIVGRTTRTAFHGHHWHRPRAFLLTLDAYPPAFKASKAHPTYNMSRSSNRRRPRSRSRPRPLRTAQLPSVGPGQVLADVISSGAVPVVHLTEVFRPPPCEPDDVSQAVLDLATRDALRDAARYPRLATCRMLASLARAP
jgi:hypothetical protein